MIRILLFIAVIIFSTPSFAQGVDWDSIGRPIGGDYGDMYDKYLFDQTTGAASANAPLRLPVLSKPEVEDYIKAKVAESLTLNSFAQSLNNDNYTTILNRVKNSFTQKGYDELNAFLNKLRLLTLLSKEPQWQITSIVLGNPALIVEGDISNVYFWRYEGDMMMTLTKGNQSSSQKFIFTVDVVRSNATDDMLRINALSFERQTEN